MNQQDKTNDQVWGRREVLSLLFTDGGTCINFQFLLLPKIATEGESSRRICYCAERLGTERESRSRVSPCKTLVAILLNVDSVMDALILWTFC